MTARMKSLTLTSLLLLPASVGALAQTGGSPAPSTHGIRGWISGHPVVDLVVVLAIIVVIAGTYVLRKRSRA